MQTLLINDLGTGLYPRQAGMIWRRFISRLPAPIYQSAGCKNHDGEKKTKKTPAPARGGRFSFLPPKRLQLLIVETFYSAEEAVLWYEVQLPSAPSKSTVTAVSPSEFQGRIVHGELLRRLLMRIHWEMACVFNIARCLGSFQLWPET